MAQQITYKIENRLYLSITDRCTLSCTFCPKNNGILRVGDYDLSMDHRPDTQEIIQAMDDPGRYDEVVFCGYGEPTLRLNVLLKVARHIKAQGGKVRVNTDGITNLVHKDNVLPEMATCVDAVSVSMNAQDAEVYERHCRPGLRGSYESMLRFLADATHHIPSVTATAIDGLQGVDIPACRRLAGELGVRFRRRILGKVG